MVDVATWEELAVRKIMEVYTQIPSLNKAVGTAVNQMITPYIPSQPVAKVSPFPAFSEPKVGVKRHSVSLESEKIVSNLDQQIAELEASMDVLLGARVRNKDQPKKGIPRFVSGEWTLDFDVDRKLEDNPENAANTIMLAAVLDQLLTNPYDVELQRPEFEYHEDDELYMTVRFPVVYKLKDKIIKDMLGTLPYTGLEQNGTLSIFYFDKNSFNFPNELEKLTDRNMYICNELTNLQNDNIQLYNNNIYLHNLAMHFQYIYMLSTENQQW